MYYVPGADVNNSYENSLDALYQIANEPRLLVFCLLYLTSIAFYNYFGLAVTRSLTGMSFQVVNMFIWIIATASWNEFEKSACIKFTLLNNIT